MRCKKRVLLRHFSASEGELSEFLKNKNLVKKTKNLLVCDGGVVVFEGLEGVEVSPAVVGGGGLGVSGGDLGVVSRGSRTDGSQVWEPSIFHLTRYSPDMTPGSTLRWSRMASTSNSWVSVSGDAAEDGGGGDGRLGLFPKMATARSAR